MTHVDREVKLRNFVIDALMARNGKALVPELIGELAQEIVTRAMDVMDFFEQKNDYWPELEEDIPQ